MILNDNGMIAAAPSDDDETTITEITIEPDGRVYVFGTSRQVLDVLERLCPGDAQLGRLLGQVRSLEQTNATIHGGATRAT